MTTRKANAPGIIATTPGKANATAGARKWRANPWARKPAANAPIKVPLKMSSPRCIHRVRVVWLATPHTTQAHAMRPGTLKRNRYPRAASAEKSASSGTERSCSGRIHWNLRPRQDSGDE